jgi:hypothetical protein
MLGRIALWGLSRYLGGPGRSWIVASMAVLGYRLIRSATGRRPVVEVVAVGRGDRILVEHLTITHQDQIRAGRAQQRAARRRAR